ncbi:SDA1 [Lepeophtheirus salmonis]|uniref:Protein SDA1 n=1 Tax=Lepeophtheirus salmonis TaxID=72036 RepID=A0A7R8CM76_LEPSM|nr:SDA1 [Lepeophtheirus salmonis]CAF2864383.1 SDA1 [Lepeophtheirus salmonis]
MSRRSASNQLPNNLPALQNLIKRDPESYAEEFDLQVLRCQSLLKTLELDPSEHSRSHDLLEILHFLSQVWHLYSKSYKEWIFPTVLSDVLKRHSTVLDSETRFSMCSDKTLRIFLKDRIVNDIKSAPKNTAIPNFVQSNVRHSHSHGAKIALDVCTRLYQSGAWHDAKTVNVITEACLHDNLKMVVTALNFFLGKDDEVEDDDDDDEDHLPSVKDIALANKVNKKSRKRKKLLENIKKSHTKKKKNKKKQSLSTSQHFILYTILKALLKNYLKNLISRLIGTHQLFILNYYTYIARFLNPHQREVVKMLQFSAQAAHELIPPDVIEPILKALANNFITERNSAEVMAVGLNAVREICKRCPLAIDETLLRDLAMYKTYKDKGVMMASKALISLYRISCPQLLHKKDRGRPTEAVAEISRKNYGEHDAKSFIPGAEALDLDKPEEDADEKNNSDDSEWEDISHSEDESEAEEEKKEKQLLTMDEKQSKASAITESRILTDADFRKVDAAQLKKQITAFRKGGKKRKFEETTNSETSGGREELVDLANIEMVYKKRKHDKEARLESVKKGREDREKFGSNRGKSNENSGSSHKVKNKKKNFSMLKHKLKFKVKRSFVDKQRNLKKALLKSKKFK